ncbi:MAG: c-type cytochrome [Candidatus Sericytochromatia bacterium]|nr:c-type cytochrome [Candidatus Sericytochromatia bacterium]
MRALLLLPLLAALAGGRCQEAPPPDSREAQVARGKAAYAKTCAICHGPAGEGYAADNAPALAGADLLVTASDAFLYETIARGRPGTVMSGWAKEHGGPWDEGQIQDLVALMRSWQQGTMRPLDQAPLRPDGQDGKTLYGKHCASCHGATGIEGPNNRLAHPQLLDLASDGFLRATILEGRAGTPMKAFRDTLRPAEVDAIIAYLRQHPAQVPEVGRPVATGSAPVDLPSGGEPDFPKGARFIGVDLAAREMRRGARILFVDARPPSDFQAGHVRGAINLPFYEAPERADQVPKGAWVLTYCGCPHAESGEVAEVLRGRGHDRVAILDEGWGPWKTRGYPIEGPARAATASARSKH